jgi:hypothetical protein
MVFSSLPTLQPSHPVIPLDTYHLLSVSMLCLRIPSIFFNKQFQAWLPKSELLLLTVHIEVVCFWLSFSLIPETSFYGLDTNFDLQFVFICYETLCSFNPFSTFPDVPFSTEFVLALLFLYFIPCFPHSCYILNIHRFFFFCELPCFTVLTLYPLQTIFVLVQKLIFFSTVRSSRTLISPLLPYMGVLCFRCATLIHHSPSFRSCWSQRCKVSDSGQFLLGWLPSILRGWCWVSVSNPLWLGTDIA